MGLPRFKGIARVSTVETTTEHRYEFGGAELRRLLRLPDGTSLTVECLGGEGIGREVKAAYDLDTGHVFVVAKVTVRR